MTPWVALGRSLIVAGALLLAAGLLLTYADRLPLRLGRLPGDILLRGRNWTFYFPITTALLASVVLSLVLWLFHRK